jgi:hypothetical protein
VSIEYKLFVPASEEAWEKTSEDQRLELPEQEPPTWVLSRTVSANVSGDIELLSGDLGERALVVRATNNSSRPYHIQAVNITSQGLILPFIPTEYLESTLLSPGKSWEFRSPANVLMLTEEEEYVRVFVTTQAIDIRGLAQEEFSKTSKGGSSPDDLLADTIENILHDRIYPPTRGDPGGSGLPPTALLSTGQSFLGAGKK